MGLMKLGVMLMVTAMCVSVTACGRNNANNAPTENGTTQDIPAENETIQGQPEYRDDVSCADIEAAVAAALGEDYWPQAEMPNVEDIGLSSDMYTECLFKAPMISGNVDTIIIVRAAKGRMEDVRKALETYRENTINDTFQYPMNIPKIQNSMIAEFGTYAVFVQLGAGYGTDAADAAMAGNPNVTEDELYKIQAEVIAGQNQKALDAVEAALK